MNEIKYTYEITSVSEEARCMEIVFSSEGRQTIHISARLPFEGEQLEDVIKMYAPVAFWIEQERSVIPPLVGHSGEISTKESLKSFSTDEISIPIDFVIGA